MLLLRKRAQTHPIIRQRGPQYACVGVLGWNCMAEHTVKVKLPKNLEVQSKDLEVVVRSYGNIIGRLKISKGSLDWRDAKDQKSHVLGWEKFARLALDHGTPRLRK